MKRVTRFAFALVVQLLVLGRPVYAQSITGSFDELTSRLRPGEPLVVTDMRGATVKGKLLTVTGSSLEITNGRNRLTPPLRIPASDINNIVVTRADPLWNGPLIGFAVGAGSALLIELAAQNQYSKFQGGSVVGMGIFSLMTGLTIDFFNKQKVVVYVRPRS